MPVYEYRCNNCQRLFSLFLRSVSAEATPVCPRCSSSDARRLISRFAVVRSEENVAEDMVDTAAGLGDVDENDPRSIARWARRMGQEAGEDLGPEFGEMVDRLEAGESPESIEQSMGGDEGPAGAGDLGGDDAGF